MKGIKKQSKLTGAASSVLKKIVPYFVFFVAILATMVIGSQKDPKVSSSNPIMSSIDDNTFVVTADQLSESYIVADLANTFNLPTTSSISENYVSISLKYTLTGATIDTGIIEKPNIIDTSNLSRGIKTYIVVDGDSLQAIADRFGVTTTQIRWSNNMKNDNLSVGQKLFIPQVPGILYTVKDGDTIEGLAEKYKSNASQMIVYNDLETTGLAAGQTIVLPGGELPETERPEYVAPTPKPAYVSYYLADSGTRHDMREIGSYSYWRYTVTPSVSGDGNRSTAGQCTWFAWYWRRYNSGSENYWLPAEIIGNARDWVRTLSSRYGVNRVPAYGAVVQTRTTGYGHVGVVTGVVPGEYITIQEMNYNGGTYRVFESKIYWSDAVNYYYIHGRM